MELNTFQLEVRTSDRTRSLLRTLTIDDRLYTLLGARKGGFGELDDPTHLARFAKLLVEDPEGNQYLIDTRDNCPIPIAAGSEDEMFGDQYQTWVPGLRLYICRLRTCLVIDITIRQDTNGQSYIVE